MDFKFNCSLVEKYTNNSQKTRVLTEDWVEHNLYCPVCGRPYINRYENNHPTGDFYCNFCSSDFELKSKQSKSDKLSKTITDGEYSTMISRITSLRNPNFFFMTYRNYAVQNFILIPNHFFTPQIIIKRKPLSPNAKRAGWTGCNIDLSSIPESGKIFIIKNQLEIERETVIANYARTKSLQTSNLESRGWLLDTLNCIERIPSKDFTLNQVYAFESELKQKHPDNNFIKDKLRQQLQYLRDKGFIEFVTPGHYKKI
ncbi:MAG: restriction endonuclease [Treponemataceae bacterium]|nr:restriction endonuclease [Treponemataceae bacterium]